MTLIEWDDKYNLGIVSIDMQHQRLVAIINQLYDSHVEGHGSDAIDGALKRLIAYSGMHFGVEERYLDEYEIPGREKHKKLHAEFVSKIKKLRKQAVIQKSGMSTTMVRFLKNWLFDHIERTDQKYRDRLRTAGID